MTQRLVYIPKCHKRNYAVVYIPRLSCAGVHFFSMGRQPPSSTPIKSSAASDVYKRQPTEAAY